MNKDFIELYKLFIKIKKIGWIKTYRDNNTGIGYTFETLINKKEDNQPLPDFKSIEIKTTRKNSKKNITLLTCSPEVNNDYPIKYLLDNFGYPSKSDKKIKVFNGTVYANKLNNIGYKNKFQLKIDKNKKRITLCVLKNTKLEETKIYWEMKRIESKFNSKLKNLAIIQADSKIINLKEHFYYNKIELYELKDFDQIIKQIEQGTIKFNFNVNYYKDSTHYGEIHDRGSNLTIEYKDIEKIFLKIK